MLRPVLCSRLVNGLVNETKSTLNKFTGVTELGGVMDAPVGSGAIQKNLSGLEEWNILDLMKTPKGNTEPCTQGGTLHTPTHAGVQTVGKNLEKKDLWTSKLTLNQWCTLVANQAIGFPSCSGQNMSSWSREEILPLCSAVGTPLECCAHLCASQHRTDIDILEEVQQKAFEMFKELVHLINRGRQRGLGLSSLERRRLR